MGWKPFKAIQRAFTPNPKSFTPANIIRVAVGAQTLGQTGGLSALSPSIGSATIVSSNPKKASVVTAALVGANSFGQVQAGDPTKPETTLNKLARIGGGAVSAFAVGSAGSNLLSTPAHTLPSGVQGPVQGFTTGEQFGNFGASLVGGSASTYAAGSFGQVVIGLLGRKVGGALLQVLSGDIPGAIKTITTETPVGPVNPFGPTQQGYSGSGGGGGFVGSNTGQINSSGVGLVAVGVGFFVLLFLLLRRKG